MRRSISGLCVAAAALMMITTTTPAVGAGGFKLLGIDAANDAPRGADLLALEVATHGPDLHLRMAMSMIPVQGSFPGAGIQWVFKAGIRTFVAETHVGEAAFEFNLYEVDGSGAFVYLSSIEGEVDVDAGIINMYVPMSDIGARKGTTITGRALGDSGDVEIHQHAQVTSSILDDFATTRSFKIR